SAVSQRVQPLEIFNGILATLVSYSVGEVIGSSRDIYYNLSSIPKYKKADNDDQAQTQGTVVTALFEESKELLIELLVNCNGKTIKAIIDTGSTVNIISSELYHQFNNLLIES
ncbi:hypothetical protein K474DRAFT_1571427, partial [Panus rudis PR-1116 ss-1]